MMTLRTIPLALSVAAVTLLAGCSSMPSFERNKPPNVTDDDAICKANGVAVGSPEYIACRKDRDAANSRENRMERAHRNLSEDMLNSGSSGNRPWER